MDGLACVRSAGIELFVLPVPSGWEAFLSCRDFFVRVFLILFAYALLRMHKYLPWPGLFWIDTNIFFLLLGRCPAILKIFDRFLCYLGC